MQFARNLIKRVVPIGAYERFRARWWRFLRPAFVDYCPVLMPWFDQARSRDAIAQVRRLAFSFYWDDRKSPVTTLCLVYATVACPVRALSEFLRQWARHGRFVKDVYGVTLRRQVAQCLWVSLRYNLPPSIYYKFRIFSLDRLERARGFLHETEMWVLYSLLVRRVAQPFDLRDKLAFFEAARAEGLPVAEVFAAVDEASGVRRFPDGDRALPRQDLVLKPVDLACGQGVEVWAYDASRDAWRSREHVLTEPELVDRARRLARPHRYLIQAHLRNHGRLRDLSRSGLCTVRLVTYRDPDSEPRALVASLRMPTGGACVDNFESGGLAGPVDLACGRVGEPVAKNLLRGRFERHPDTGLPIAGLILPDWSEAVALAERAHRCFSWMPTVGWDVALTPSGPVLLEANPNWCVELIQIAHGVPLGETDYPRFFLAWTDGTTPVSRRSCVPFQSGRQ